MRYIRTDNEVYDTEELWEDSRLNGKPYVTKLGWCIYKESIVASADTIEELCDEFCLLGNDGTKLVYNISDWLDLKEKILSNKAWIKIYGAIWTDRGLIYVAKMNDKGELKLL